MSKIKSGVFLNLILMIMPLLCSDPAYPVTLVLGKGISPPRSQSKKEGILSLFLGVLSDLGGKILLQ